MGFIEHLFSTNGFMPHGCCYAWDPAVIWLHVVSDALITLAYYSIPVTLVYFARKRTDLVFDWMFVCFAIFITACGTTHLMEILNIWHPTYWLSGLIKAFTAAVSIVTAILLIRLVPHALALPSPEQLRRSNEALQREIAERTLATDKITQLNVELQKQTTRLEEANKELESFGYSISHDLRAPLRHIDGYVGILREECTALKETDEHYLDIISKSAREMGVLIDNLLEFSRMGRAALNPKLIDTKAMVLEVRDELCRGLNGRKIEWEIGALPQVYADGTLLKQVWINLFDNALKYTKYIKTAVISAGYREVGDEIEFFVKDNGAGFDMQYADKLFGVFQRLHRKDEFEGTGVGLANVHRIVVRHGGRIWAESKVDGGAMFYFTLPKKASA